MTQLRKGLTGLPQPAKPVSNEPKAGPCGALARQISPSQPSSSRRAPEAARRSRQGTRLMRACGALISSQGLGSPQNSLSRASIEAVSSSRKPFRGCGALMSLEPVGPVSPQAVHRPRQPSRSACSRTRTALRRRQRQAGRCPRHACLAMAEEPGMFPTGTCFLGLSWWSKAGGDASQQCWQAAGSMHQAAAEPACAHMS